MSTRTPGPRARNYSIQGDATAQGTQYGTKYDVQSLTYPADLYGRPENYGNSWVMININVNTSSRIAGSYGGFVDLNEVEKKNFTERLARVALNGPDREQAIKAGIAIAAGSAAIAGIKEKISGSGKSYVEAGKAAGKAALGTAFALAPLVINEPYETKRIKTAIQLPMPNNIMNNYSAGWGEESTQLFDMAMRAAGAISFDAISNITSPGAFANVTGQIGDAASSLSLATQSFLGGGGVSSATGMAANPKKEMIFQGVNFKQFVMTYTLYPKSEQEAQIIHDIIHELKFHMHPEFKTDGRFTFIFPSEFDVTFYTGGKENLWISRLATCVLTDLNVNYTPNAIWATKASVGVYEGYPNNIEVQMSFRELSLHTKDTIAKGF
jgi:hypothetical protein